MQKIKTSSIIAAILFLLSGCQSLTPATKNHPSPAIANSTISPGPSTSYHSASPISSISQSLSPTASPPAKATATNSNQLVINEDNFTQYFQFGMNHKKVEDILKDLKIDITDEGSGGSGDNVPDNFYYIAVNQNYIIFNFNNKDQLYSIDVSDTNTAKLNIGDSVTKIYQLYGKEDEYDAQDYEHVYYRNGYMFSISVVMNKVSGWSVFVDTWNQPNDFSSANNQGKPFGEDNLIKFNENNYSNYFKFGMQKSSVEKMLTDYGIRITREVHYVVDEAPSLIYTDHIIFYFDYKNKLYGITVNGWETAKGLNLGDTFDKLHLLYGKEKSNDSTGDLEYTYKIKRFWFVLDFDPDTKGLEYWSLYSR